MEIKMTIKKVEEAGDEVEEELKKQEITLKMT